MKNLQTHKRYGSGLQTGKLIKLQDATGVTDFEYDDMGNVASQTRMHILPNNSWLTHRTNWEYDSWGRTKKIIYPDGEKVEYYYNNAGNLNKVASSQNGDYISNILYNKLEQKTDVFYGNGTFAEYVYEPIMNRLTEQRVVNSAGKIMQKFYHYNSIGNIDKLNSHYADANISIAENYYYDQDNRLVSASSNAYNLTMTYSEAGRILTKNLTGTGQTNGGSFPINFVNTYNYESLSNNPYAVRELNGNSNDYLKWDNNGNLCFRKAQGEFFYWTEDNRMQAYYNHKTNAAAHYRYDAAGQRDLKLVGEVVDININGHYFKMPYYDRATLYASNLMTIDYSEKTRTSYTKHYFAGAERILANVAGGGQANIEPVRPIEPIYEETDILSKNFTTFAAEYLKKANEADNVCEQNDIELPADLSSIPHLGIEFDRCLRNGNSDKLYYFHSDHLSSASLITNSAGETHQTLHHTPFSTNLINIFNGNYDVENKFSGWKFDAESGLYDMGARPLDEHLGSITPDDFWWKRPDKSAYLLCSNNPIMRIDPDGNDDIPVDENGNFKRDQNGNLQIIKTDLPHRLAVDTKGADGTTTQKYYTLADQKNDYNDIKNGTINKVVSVNKGQIKSMLKDAGVFNAWNRTSSYLKNESEPHGNLDFSYEHINKMFEAQGVSFDPINYPSPMLFIPEGDKYAHNHMNFGNFMWGAAGYTMGFTSLALRTLAHIFTYTHPQNYGDGKTRMWDSKDDQLSIDRGTKFASQQKYRYIFK